MKITKKYLGALLAALLTGLGTVQQAQGMTDKDWASYALWKGVENNDIVRIKRALENGAPVDDRNRIGTTPLIQVCGTNYTEYAKIFIEKGANVNAQNSFGNAPLIFACEYGNTELATLLVEKGAEVNIRDESGNTPLINACNANNTEIVKLLLEKGAQVNVQNKKGDIPLSLACHNKNIFTINVLIAHGAKITSIREEFKPIISNVPEAYMLLGSFYINGPEKSDLKIIKNLARTYEYAKILADANKAEILMKQKEATKRLWVAIEQINKSGVIQALNDDANIRAHRDADTMTSYAPIELACRKKSSEIINILIAHNTSVFMENIEFLFRSELILPFLEKITPGCLNLGMFGRNKPGFESDITMLVKQSSANNPAGKKAKEQLVMYRIGAHEYGTYKALRRLNEIQMRLAIMLNVQKHDVKFSFDN